MASWRSRLIVVAVAGLAVAGAAVLLWPSAEEPAARAGAKTPSREARSAAVPPRSVVRPGDAAAVPASGEPPALHAVHGRVVDEAGRAVAGATVRLLHEELAALRAEQALPVPAELELEYLGGPVLGPEEPAEPEAPAEDLEPVAPVDPARELELATSTDEEGRFAFDALPPGRFVLVARLEPGPPASADVELPHEEELELVLGAGAELSGRVLDEEGRPIRGARVQIRVPPDGVAEAAAGGDGSFRLAGLPQGEVDGFVVADGYLPDELFVTTGEPPVTLVLERPRAASGVVLQGGAPVADALVSCTGKEDVRTGPDGTFAFAALRPELVEVRATLGSAGSETLALDLGRGSVEDVILELHAPGALVVAVRDESGAPLAGTTVRVVPPEGFLADELLPVWTTGPDGVASFREVPSGPVTILAQAPDRRRVDVDDEIRPGETSQVTVVLQVAHVLEVHVRVGGQPAPDGTRLVAHQATVDGDRSTHEVARNGVARMALSPGRATVTAMHQGLASASAETEVPGPPLVIELDRGERIEGHVLRPDGGPAPYVAITARPEVVARIPGVPVFPQLAHSIEDGSFVLEGLRPGRWKLSTFEDGSEAEPVVVDAGASGVEIRLRRTVSIRGTVMDGHGGPARGARVLASDPASGTFVADGEADAAGEFEVAGLAAGADVELRADRGAVSSTPVRARGGDAGVRLRLPAGTTLRGRVVDTSGRPIRSFSVEGDPVYDPGGAFELEEIGDGVEAIFVTAPGMAEVEVPVVLAEGRTVNLGAIRLAPASRLGGTVVDARGVPVPHALIRAQVASDDELSVHGARTDAAGRFLLAELPPGDVELHAEAGAGRADAVARVEPGTTTQLVLRLEPRTAAREAGR